MAKSLAAAFIRGFAGQQLSEIDERRKTEAEVEKLRMLEQLRRETTEWEEGLPSKVLDRKSKQAQIDLAANADKRAADEVGYRHGRDSVADKQWAAKHRLDELQTAASIRNSDAQSDYYRSGGSRRGGLDDISDDESFSNPAYEVGAKLLKDPEFAPIVDRLVAEAGESEADQASVKERLIGLAATSARIGAANPKLKPKERANFAREAFKKQLMLYKVPTS